MKQYTTLALAGLLVLALAAPALAGPGGPHRRMAGSPAATQEQQTRYDALLQDFMAKVTPLHDELMGKMLELRAISGNPSTTRADVKALVDEIVSLRGQIRTERQAFATALKKEGIPFGAGGWGHWAGDGCGMMGGGMMRDDMMMGRGMMHDGLLYDGMMRGHGDW